MFQGGGSGGGGGVGVRPGTGDPHHTSLNTSVLSAPSSASVSDNDRSPELKRKRIGDAALSGSRESLSAFHSRPLPSSSAVSLSAPDLLPHQPEPNLMEATSHVQRFNYTRMLFAKMEEESRLAQEREKVMRRKVSPSHTPSSPPPALSPRSPPPMSPTRKVSSHDDVSRLSEEMVEQCFSERGRRDHSGSMAGAHKDVAAWESASQQHEEPIKSSSSSYVSSRPGAHHSSVSSATVTLRSQPDLIGDNIPGDRTGKYIPNLDLIKSAESVDKKERAGSDLQSVRTRVTGSLNRQQDSRVDHPPKAEHSTRRSRPSPPDSLSSLSSHSSPTPKQENGVDSSVTMRQKKSAASADSVKGKRLSKEEIEAALERADNYLSTMHPPTEAGESKSVKRRSWDVRRQREDLGTKRYSLDEESGASARKPRQTAPSEAHKPAAASEVGDEIDRMPASAADIAKVTLEGLSQDAIGDHVGIASDIPPPSYESSAYVHVRASRRVSPEDKPKATKPTPPANKPSPVPRRSAPPPPLPSKPPKAEVSAPVAPPPPAVTPGQWEDRVEERVEPTVQSASEVAPPDWGDSVVSTSFGPYASTSTDSSEQILGKLLLR